MPGRVMSREARIEPIASQYVADLGHAWCRRDRDPSPSVSTVARNCGLKFIDPLADFPLGIFRGRFQPEIVDLA